MKTESLSYSESDLPMRNTNSDVRVRREGEHPEHGSVVLETVHAYDGIAFYLYDEDGNEIRSGWMDTADIDQYIE